MNSFLIGKKNDKKEIVTCMSRILVVRSSWSVLFPLLFVPWLQWSCFFLHLGCQRACAHWQGGLQAYEQDDFNYTGRWERSLSVSHVNWHLEEMRTFEVGREKWWKDGALASSCVCKAQCAAACLYFSSIVAWELETWPEEEIKALYFLQTLYIPAPFSKQS